MKRSFLSVLTLGCLVITSCTKKEYVYTDEISDTTSVSNQNSQTVEYPNETTRQTFTKTYNQPLSDNDVAYNEMMSKYKNPKTDNYYQDEIDKGNKARQQITERNRMLNVEYESSKSSPNYIETRDYSQPSNSNTDNLNHVKNQVQSEYETKSKSSYPNSNDVKVNGYNKSDGTHIDSHMRTAPNNTTSDNYSTSPNTNPYTGQVGTK